MRRALWLLSLTSCNAMFGIDELTGDATEPSTASIAVSTSATVGAGGGVVSSTAAATIGAGGSSSQGGAPTNAPKRVFVTSAEFPGSLGGVPAANTFCANAAADLGGGGWRAWISDSAHDAVVELVEVGPWYLVNGTTLVALDKEQLASGQLDHAINLDENENPREVPVWTGTSASGTVAGGLNQHCYNWTTPSALGRVGMSGETGEEWTSVSTGDCGSTYSLYCFEQ